MSLISKVKLLLLFVLCALFVSLMRDFPCTHNVCKVMHCEPKKSCEYPNSYIKKKGGLCGCCDECIVIKNEGEICNVVVNEMYPPKIMCAPGLECHEYTRRCRNLTVIPKLYFSDEKENKLSFL
ncbi:UNVERIFIED_CONTAM: hypothetical protein NCL1_33657 [Trichonephila clavipes]